jgi:hypothetical protein
MDLMAANHYVVDGIVTGTIDTAGITGNPVLALRFGDDELPDAQFSDVISGLQVTASLPGVPDLFERHLTLLVPVVNTASEAVPFVGIAMLTTTRTSIGGPRLVEGPLQRYEIHPVGGVASIVES